MKYVLYLLFLSGFLFFSLKSRAADHAELHAISAGDGIDFIENKGQWNKEAQYKAEIPGGVVFLTANGFVYNFQEDAFLECSGNHPEAQPEPKIIKGHAYKVNFLGANPASERVETDKRSFYHNYFIGNDPSRWAGNVSLYGTVYYKDIYKGTDLHIYSQSSTSLKYDLIVKAGNDPSLVTMGFDGVTPELDDKGNLVIQTTVNKVVEHAPYSYQVINGKEVEVKSRYRLKKGQLTFDFPEGYNAAYDLIIDPILVFASFSGAKGSSAYYAHSTTFDLLGNTYSAAYTAGREWPTTTGAYQTTFPNGSSTAAILKINPTGTQILYATYFGASGGTLLPNTLRVNNKNELFMAGSTNLPNMPLTENAYQKTRKGTSDLYLVHFTEKGDSLLGSTLMGGSNIECATTGATNALLSNTSSSGNPAEIAFDKNGSVWVTTNSSSTDFPVTSNAAQDKLAGVHDAVIFNISADCSQLLYSTYFGGDGWDGGITIEADNNDEYIVVAGWTQSSKLPAAESGLHSANIGNADGFVTRLNKKTLKFTNTTFLGTANQDYIQCVAFDKEDNIYVAGRSLGGIYPTTPGVYVTPNGNIFLQKMDPELKTSLASTRIGPASSNVQPSAMIVDICGNILLSTIGTRQIGLPVTSDAFDTVARPFWFCALRPDYTDLYFASYFGSNNDHFHTGVARMDRNGIVYHSVCAAGSPETIDFPTTPNSYAPKKLNANTNDNITFKFNFEATGVQSNFVLDPDLPLKDTGCAPYHVAFKNTSSTAQNFVWDFGDGSPTTTATNPSHIFTSPGQYTVTLYAYNDTSCVTSDTSYMDIVVLYVEKPEIEVSDTILCHYEQKINIGVTVKNPGPHTAIQWGPAGGVLSAPDQAVVTVDPSAYQAYYVTVKDTIPGICALVTVDTVHIDLSPRELRILNSDTLVCESDVVKIIARSTPGYTYRWSPTTGVDDTTALEPEITIKQPDVYTLTASYPGCLDTSVAISIGMQHTPRVELGPDMAVCEGAEVALESRVSPFRNDYIYQWQPTEGLNTPNGPNADFIATESTTYSLEVKTPIGCASLNRIRVVVYPGRFGSIISDTGVCPHNTVDLWAAGGTKYVWTPAYGLSDPTIANPVASPRTPTLYTVIITDIHNCVDTEQVFVQIYPGAELTLPDSVTIYPGEEYQIDPGTNCIYFQWFPPSGISNTEIANPTASPEVRTRYYVTAQTEYGCTIKDSIDVLVEATLIDMPNAFSPTGVNNTFKPSKRGIAVLKNFSVYNRWGAKVFSTTQIDEGWDGTYKGKPQPVGTYVYVIEAVTDSGKEFIKRGNVTLLK